MTTQEEVEIIKEAVDTFGFNNQRRILQEECAELIVAASHYDRGRPGAYENFVEELADVDIMINQMIYALSANVDEWKKKKLARLKERVEQYKSTPSLMTP